MSNIIDIVEEHYELLRPYLATRENNRGRPPVNDLRVLKGILWVLRSGARWKDLPKEYPSYQTCHRRFQFWVATGLLSKVLKVLVNQLEVDLSEVYVDGSFSLAKRGGAKVGKSMKGTGSKLMLLLSKNQIPVSLELHGASRHETTFIPSLIRNRMVRSKLARIIGDKAYDSNPLDELLKKNGIDMIAPNRDCRKIKNQDRRKLRRMRRRYKIERFFAWLKANRRLAIRWENNPDNFQGLITLACIVLVLRHF